MEPFLFRLLLHIAYLSLPGPSEPQWLKPPDWRTCGSPGVYGPRSADSASITDCIAVVEPAPVCLLQSAFCLPACRLEQTAALASPVPAPTEESLLEGSRRLVSTELDATDRARVHVGKFDDIAPAALETATMHCTQSVKTLITVLQGLTHQLMQLLDCLRFVQPANFSGWHVLLQRFKLYRHDVLQQGFFALLCSVLLLGSKTL